jgi:uncharacterized protein YutE (UPF0331/DUF86 family)
MVNPEEIRHRLSEIKEALDYLRSSKEEIKSNRESYLLGRYFLQIMLEAVFTIGNQIIADGGFRKPTSYKDILMVLKDQGIIKDDLFLELIPFADLRNRLVHTYWKISQNELLEIVNNLSPFEDYAKIVVNYINQ